MAGIPYYDLGCRPVINGCGAYTDFGGSIPSARVVQAMLEANQYYVSMSELLDKTGQIAAALMDAEAARITPGASAAITLAAAACMAGTDPAKVEQLPDTTGMRSRVLIQANHMYEYAPMVRLSGAKLIKVGDDEGTTADQLASSLGADTAAVFFPAHLEGTKGTLPLAETVQLAKASAVPVIVDAAYMNYPTSLMSSFGRQGADLVIFSAKYFGGPNAGGFLYGRRDLIQAVAAVDFVNHHTLVDFARHLTVKRIKFGRPFKQDRQVVVGTLEALREWLEMDHDERLASYGRRVDVLAGCIGGVAGVLAKPMHFSMEEELSEPGVVNCLVVELDPNVARSADLVYQGLTAGSPAVAPHLRKDMLILDVQCMLDEHAEVAGKRLREELDARTGLGAGGRVDESASRPRGGV